MQIGTQAALGVEANLFHHAGEIGKAVQFDARTARDLVVGNHEAVAVGREGSGWGHSAGSISAFMEPGLLGMRGSGP